MRSSKSIFPCRVLIIIIMVCVAYLCFASQLTQVSAKQSVVSQADYEQYNYEDTLAKEKHKS
jgi:hypothetical protein